MAARTHHKYDLVPYPEWSITESHHNHMAVIGRLMGIKTPSPEHCRVLELGCASGGNMIPAAYYWPHCEFVGVELSKRQVEHGNRLITEIGLKNARILHKDIMQVDRRLGSFDYIIVHGVYSWVPARVQEHILKICRELLPASGLAYISYNTLPGWSMRNMIRAMLFYHVQGDAEPRKQIRESLAFLRLLGRALPENGSLSERWLKHEAMELAKSAPDYVFHDYLEENNHPLFFHQFMSQASAAGLRYVSDATLSSMLASSLSAEANEFLDGISDLVDYEQYMDYFYLRHFRQSILCHAERRPKRELDLAVFRRLHCSAHLTCAEEVNLRAAQEQVFTGAAGQRYRLAHPLSKAAMVALTLAYPNALTLPQLQAQAEELLRRYGSDEFVAHTAQLETDLLNLYLSGAVRATLVQRQIFADLSECPSASPLARVYARHRKGYVATAHHDSLELDRLGWRLITLADGKRPRSAIVKRVLDDYRKPGQLHDYLAGRGIVDEAATEQLASQVEAQLYQYATQGLMIS